MNLAQLVPFGTSVLQIVIPAMFGGAFVFVATDIASKLRKGIFTQVLSDVNKIDDPKLREAVHLLLQYAASKMPTASENEILKFIIAELQRATPDWIVSDEKLAEIVSREYDIFITDSVSSA